MTLTDRELAEQYLETNPAPSVAEFAGALELAPDRAADLLDELTSDTDAPLDTHGGKYPLLNTGFNSWVCWMYIENDGKRRKQPFAPYSDLPRYSDDGPHKFSWSHPANLTEFETAREWARKHPDMRGVGFIIQSEAEPYQEPADPTVMIDLDDVINPEKGTMHPYARELVFDRAGSYADVSVSRTGSHIIGVGSLPDGVRTIQGELPEHPDFPGAEIEVYDGKRFCAMTGYWLTETPREVNDVDSLIDELAEEFTTTDDSEPSLRQTDPIDIDNAEFTETETTDNFEELLDAINSVRPKDIRLRSPETGEQSDGSVSRDPSFANSESGTRIGEFGDGWVYRDGMKPLDALQIVALEENIITSPGENPEGKDFWKAVQKLRDRGANIPRYEGSEIDRFGLAKDAETKEEKRRKALRALRATE